MQKKKGQQITVSKHKGIIAAIIFIILLVALLWLGYFSTTEADQAGQATQLYNAKNYQQQKSLDTKTATSNNVVQKSPSVINGRKSNMNAKQVIASKSEQPAQLSGVVFLRQNPISATNTITAADTALYFISDLYFELNTNADHPLATIGFQLPNKKGISIALQCSNSADKSCISSDKHWIRTFQDGKWIITQNTDGFSAAELTKIWGNTIFFTDLNSLKIECNQYFTKCIGTIPASINYETITDTIGSEIPSNFFDNYGTQFYERAGPLCPINTADCKEEEIGFAIALKNDHDDTHPLLLTVKNNYYQQFDNLIDSNQKPYDSNVIYKTDANQYKFDEQYGGKGCYCKQSTPLPPPGEMPLPIIPSKTAAPVKIIQTAAPQETTNADKICFDIGKGLYTMKDNKDGTYTLVLQENK